MRVQSGQETVFAHFDQGYMWAGQGDRSVTKTINFAKPFAAPPHVIVSLVGVDASNGGNLRVFASVSAVDEHHFDVTVKTWNDTRLATVEVSWIAVEAAQF